ncbi:MAG TPA: hypothetical protein ENG48_00750 [Candidatus Atribacteria bacterium]|nr:hypothetical protein [Candidatus Atribacteria bacterium]
MIINKKLILSLILFIPAILFTGCYFLNISPVIETEPITTAKEGVTYTYDVDATDLNGDTLTYSLITCPSGMTINSTTGVITWTPTTAGSFEVSVEVSDGSRTDTQPFTITVDETLLTSIEVLPSTMSIVAGSSKTITSVTAHYDNGTSADIALTACTYTSNNPTKLTVTNGVIAVSSTCSATTAIITVSYTENDVTKSDTVTVTITSSGGG